MNAVNSAAGEDAMRGLMGTAFTVGEPGLPEVDDVMATVELLGARIRHRQRVRTGIAAAALCVAGFGMVAGIGAVAHSSHSDGTTVIMPGGGPATTTDSSSVDGTGNGTGDGTGP